LEIEIIDVIDCKISKALADIIRPCLSYTAFFYQQGPYRKIRREYQKSLLEEGASGSYFKTGLLDRVLDYCKKRNVSITVKGKVEKLPVPENKVFMNDLTLNGKINLREEQLRLIIKAIKSQRGVLVAPTGVGKTAMGLAIVAVFPKASVLWLCHTKDLMYQAAGEAEKLLDGKRQIGLIGDGKYDPHAITMATRQSFIKYADEIGCDYDIVIVDETHHLAKESGQYAELLKWVFAPVRIGLTATMPDNDEARLTIEGLLGPIIDEVTIREGQSLKIMAEIKIKFLKIPTDHKLRELRKYSDVYAAGVVENRDQHRIIVETAKGHIEKGDSVLILVTQISHGENILYECERQGVEAVYAQGMTEGSIRAKIKDALNEKKIHCVIATTVFREGINLPELNVLINASGGKSEIATLQAVGRGLRLTEMKKTLIFYDTVNLSHNYLISHLGERLTIYTEAGWL